MSKHIAIFAGSFDPVTNGHVDVIAQALNICDHLVMAIGVQASKTPLLSFDQRADLLRGVAGPLAERAGTAIEVVSFSGLLVETARQYGARTIVRGLRDGTDLNYEMQMAGMNQTMAPEIGTIFVPASPSVRHITATLVRQIAAMGGDIAPFAPAAVVEAMAGPQT